MLSRLLAAMGLAVINLDAVAAALASRLLADFDAATLDKRGTMEYLRTRYMRLVADYGLPAEPCADVAARAWAILARARGDDVGESDYFKFYDD